MPDPALRVGFFGKLPSAGDFVTRGLPAAFVAPWDRWVTRHLVPRLAPGAPPLYFHRPGAPAFTGVVVTSRDSAGRRFPLTLAAACPDAPLTPESLCLSQQDQRLDGAFTVKRASVGWLSAVAALAQTAVREGFPPDTLAARLAACAGPAGAWPPRFLLWTDPAAAHAADPDHPGPVLDALIGAPAEAG